MVDVTSGAVRPILTAGESALGRVCAPVEPNDPNLASTIADLAVTLADFKRRSGFGRAISAPQLGIEKRLIVLDLGAGPVPLLNPEITWRSPTMQTVWDDCLSVPGVLVRVERHESVSLRYTDPFNRRHEWTQLTPELSELLQHEIDHLDGILMTRRARNDDEIVSADRRLELVDRARARPRISVDGIRNARALVDPCFTGSPQYECEALSSLLGCRIVLKVETLNPIRCFKGRGASVYVRRHVSEHPGEPIVAASAGNWGQALALACRNEGVPLVVYAAETANPHKIERMRAFGAEVRLHGQDFDAAKARARVECATMGWRLAEDGLDVSVSEGHGSIAIELLEGSERDGQHLDAIVVPLGNGALVNGIGRWSKAASPATRIVAVCPRGAPAMYESWRRPPGAEVVVRDRVDTIADGLAVRIPIADAVDDMRGVVDDVSLVTDDELLEAMRLLHAHAGILAEPSGAAGLAAICSAPERFAGSRVAVIVTGSNIDPQVLRSLW